MTRCSSSWQVMPQRRQTLECGGPLNLLPFAYSERTNQRHAVVYAIIVLSARRNLSPFRSNKKQRATTRTHQTRKFLKNFGGAARI